MVEVGDHAGYVGEGMPRDDGIDCGIHQKVPWQGKFLRACGVGVKLTLKPSDHEGALPGGS